MDSPEIIPLIEQFNKISITETDVTSEAERNLGLKIVVVQYSYEGRTFQTQKLYYQNITSDPEISQKDKVMQYFDFPVFWLDITKHNWPKGKGESELDVTVVSEIHQKDDLEFRRFLLGLANNNGTGIIQKITADGRSQMYKHNLENNNHWHDLILWIKAVIDSKGTPIDKKYFSRLVFKWDGGADEDRTRATLTDKAYPCDRSIVNRLYENIKLAQKTLQMHELNKLLNYKKQIILQGPPGTGKTRLAKSLSKQLILQKVIDSDIVTQFIVKGLVIETE